MVLGRNIRFSKLIELLYNMDSWSILFSTAYFYSSWRMIWLNLSSFYSKLSLLIETDICWEYSKSTDVKSCLVIRLALVFEKVDSNRGSKFFGLCNELFLLWFMTSVWICLMNLSMFCLWILALWRILYFSRSSSSKEYSVAMTYLLRSMLILFCLSCKQSNTKINAE